MLTQEPDKFDIIDDMDWKFAIPSSLERAPSQPFNTFAPIFQSFNTTQTLNLFLIEVSDPSCPLSNYIMQLE